MRRKWATKVNGKIVLHGAKGYRIGKVGRQKQKSYCDMSLGISKKFTSARLKTSPNFQSRRKWKCPISEVKK